MLYYDARSTSHQNKTSCVATYKTPIFLLCVCVYIYIYIYIHIHTYTHTHKTGMAHLKIVLTSFQSADFFFSQTHPIYC